MTDQDTAPSAVSPREERLAAKLRENLRRRKAQARALHADAAGENGESDGALSKPDPSR